MKRTILTFALFLITINLKAQNMTTIDLAERVATIEDRMAIKYVVDEFSTLADLKAIDKQVLLFTEDGEVESISKGQPSTVLKGREQLRQTFSAFLSNFHTIFHQNGQQTIDLESDKAETTSYCTVILIGSQNGKEIKTTLYAIYKDSLVKENGHWLIKHRTSNFVYQEVEELK